MNEPDLFWGPLLGVYSGMRIGEATQIRVQDVHLADSGVLHAIAARLIHAAQAPKARTANYEYELEAEQGLSR